MKHLLMASCIALSLAACQTTAPSSDPAANIHFETSAVLKEQDFPLSYFTEADGWVFLSGMLGIVHGKGLIEGGITPETRQTMENIKENLAKAGLSTSNLVKCTAILADMKDWPAFNEEYKKHFNGTYPARTAFQAAGLAFNARVEVECIAKK